MSEQIVKKPNKLGGKIWLCIIIFGLVGQLAWVVENVYFSTYIQKRITTETWATSATVAASAIMAALATIFGGALTDRIGKRKPLVCFGYIIWGLVTASFAFFGNSGFTSEDNVALIAIIFVIMDCVMTLFGSLSNDAAFSAWITDVTDITNRGLTDTILSILPVAALMLIFVVFDGLTQSNNWTLFFILLGGITVLAGVIGLFTFKDSPTLTPNKTGAYMQEVIYGFVPKNVKANKMIYVCLIGMMFSGLSMQLWQPQMIMLIQYTIGLENYVPPLAIVVLLSAVVAVICGKMMDKYGKGKFFYPVAIAGVLGGLIVYAIKFVGDGITAKFIMFCIGGTLIESASLMAAGLFNASARDYTPSDKAGCFQGVRIIIYVTLPMVLASLLNLFIIPTFGEEILVGSALLLKETGYHLGDHVYPFEMFLFSAIAAAFVFIPAVIVKKNEKSHREKKLSELEAIDPQQ